MKTIFTNGIILWNGAELEGYELLIEGDKIVDILDEEYTGDAEVIDVKGAYISPGWIELHTHGIAGEDFMDADPEGMVRALEAYARHGVTSVYPTTLSAPFEEIRRSLEAMATIKDYQGGAAFLGAHLEGPYFAPSQRGAQPQEALCTPADKEYEQLLKDYPFIARIDTAPELAGSAELADYMKANNKICGIAHTDANAEVICNAKEGQYPIATHLYSGMSGVHRENGHRIAGAVEACLLRDDIFCEAICDGIHLPAELLKLIYKVKGAEKMILVSDSIRGAELPESSTFIMGNRETGYEAFVSEGVAWIPDHTAYAGSVATYDRLIRTAVTVADIPLVDAVRMATEAPARVMGLANKGRLEPGFDADITIFDKDFSVLYTVVGGKIVHKKGE